MNIIKIHGRLANQLFLFAFAYSVGKKSKSIFHFEINKYYGFKLSKYFKLRKFEIILQYLSSILFFIKSKKKFITIKEYSNTNSSTISQNIGGDIIWDGHFQSYKYFKDFDSDIRKLFRIKRKYIKMFKNKYFDLFSKYNVTVIHLRLTDYKLSGNEYLGGQDLTLPFEYYRYCLNQLDKENKIEKLIVISDDIDKCKESFKEFQTIDVFYESNTEIIDFQIILNAHYLILSNSSFSWWGAFLNSNKKRVYAPKYWLGFNKGIQYPMEITDDLDWEIVDFTAL